MPPFSVNLKKNHYRNTVAVGLDPNPI